jgi:hypothetical protein
LLSEADEAPPPQWWHFTAQCIILITEESRGPLWLRNLGGLELVFDEEVFNHQCQGVRMKGGCVNVSRMLGNEREDLKQFHSINAQCCTDSCDVTHEERLQNLAGDRVLTQFASVRWDTWRLWWRSSTEAIVAFRRRTIIVN